MSKYLFVVPTLSRGGAERQVSVISSALSSLGQEVCIVKYFTATYEYPVDEKVKVICFVKDESAYLKSNRFKRILFLRKTIQQLQPDFVIPFIYYVAVAVRIATIRLKVNILNTVRNNPNMFPPHKRDRFIRDWLIRTSKCILVQNITQIGYFDKRLHNKMHVLYNAINDDYFNICHTSNSNDFVFISAGRLVGQKNFDLLIRSFIKAFSKDQPVKLVIYGEGYLRGPLQALIDAMGYSDKILLPGRTNDIAEVYSHADAFVLSSDFEGMPNALIEAMAAGLPCISTDCPTGPSDLIDNRISGILVPVRDEAAMSSALKNIYEDKPFCKMLSVYGRLSIKDRCSAEQIAQQLITICEENRFKEYKT